VHSLVLAREWERLGHQVRIVAPASGAWDGPGDFHSCGNWSVRDEHPVIGAVHLALIYARLIAHLIYFARDADVIYARDHFSGAIACLAPRPFRPPVVREVNGLAWAQRVGRSGGRLNRLYERFAWACDRLSFKRSEARIFVSAGMLDAVRRRMDLPGDRTYVIANGVDPSRLIPSAGTRERIRAELGLADRIVVTFVGTMNPWHGVDTLIEAVSRLGDVAHLAVVMVGDGPARGPAQARADQLGYGDVIKWLGRLSEQEVPNILAASDICVSCHLPGVLCSPLKLREYLAAGRPVVQSRIADTEFLEDEGIGLRFDAGNADDFAATLRELIQDPQRLQRGERARRYACEHLTWSRVAERTVLACEAAIAARRG
jgi:glycosyltransferase involved in cell wall biosynthesis